MRTEKSFTPLERRLCPKGRSLRKYIRQSGRGLKSLPNFLTGFTLVEVIVAVALVSLITTLVASFLWLSFRLTSRSKEVAIRLAGIRNVLEIMEGEIRSAFKFDYNGENFIISEGKSISFWMSLPCEDVQSTYPLEVLRISYFVKTENGKSLLYKKLESPFKDLEEKEIPILEGNFNFLALLYDEDKNSLIELESYPREGKQDEIPLAVKIYCLKNDVRIEKVVYIPRHKEL